MLTAFWSIFCKRAEGRESGRTDSSRRSPHEPTVCTMVEFSSAVIHWVIGRHVGCRVCRSGDCTGPPVIGETLVGGQFLFGEPQGRADWRSRMGIHGVVVSGTKSLHDLLGKTGSIPRRTSNDDQPDGRERFGEEERGEEEVGSCHTCVGGHLVCTSGRIDVS